MRSITRTDDIDNQSIANYSYDIYGRLVSDIHDGVTLIKWSKSDKVLEVHKPNGVLTIKYNALDQKVSQSTSRNDSIITEYFVYDPSGNVFATYGDTIKIQNFNVVSRKFSLHQLTIYGSSRIGLIEVDSLLWKDGVSNVVTSNVYTQKLGLKRYELSNHLGNVQTVLSDRKLVDSHLSGQITAWIADVISVSDYYPFGLKIIERSWSSDTYRFGFNGKDFFSEWNRQDYGFRIYDSRKCRFESVDPLSMSYPELTTYQFASNMPINCIDLEGAEGLGSISDWVDWGIQQYEEWYYGGGDSYIKTGATAVKTVSDFLVADNVERLTILATGKNFKGNEASRTNEILSMGVEYFVGKYGAKALKKAFGGVYNFTKEYLNYKSKSTVLFSFIFPMPKLDFIFEKILKSTGREIVRKTATVKNLEELDEVFMHFTEKYDLKLFKRYEDKVGDQVAEIIEYYEGKTADGLKVKVEYTPLGHRAKGAFPKEAPHVKLELEAPGQGKNGKSEFDTIEKYYIQEQNYGK